MEIVLVSVPFLGHEPSDPHLQFLINFFSHVELLEHVEKGIKLVSVVESTLEVVSLLNHSPQLA